MSIEKLGKQAPCARSRRLSDGDKTFKATSFHIPIRRNGSVFPFFQKKRKKITFQNWDSTGVAFPLFVCLNEKSGHGCGKCSSAFGFSTGRRCWLVVSRKREREKKKVNSTELLSVFAAVSEVPR